MIGMDNYSEEVVAVLNKYMKDYFLIYVSANLACDKMNEKISHRGNILYLDLVTEADKQGDLDDCIYLGPNISLTQTMLAVKKACEKIKARKIVVIDSLSALLRNCSEVEVVKFTNYLSSYAALNKILVLLFLLKEDEKKMVIRRIISLSDNVIRDVKLEG